MNCTLERERERKPLERLHGSSLGPGFSAGPCWRRWAGLGGSPQHLGTSAGTSECGPAPLFPLIVRALKFTLSICSTCWEAQGTQLALERPNCPSPYRRPPHLCRASAGVMPGSGQNPGPPTQASSQLSAPLSPLTCLHSIFKCHWGKILQKEISRSLQGTEAGEERCSFQMADRGQKLSMGQTKSMNHSNSRLRRD